MVLDISKESIAVAIANSGREAPRFYSMIPNTSEAARKRVDHVGKMHNPKYVMKLDRRDMECIVVAPALKAIFLYKTISLFFSRFHKRTINTTLTASMTLYDVGTTHLGTHILIMCLII